MQSQLDIVIPVYNEGENIVGVLRGLSREVKTPARVLICYDRPDDDTLPAVRANPDAHLNIPVEFVRNPSRGAHAAIMAGFAASTAPLVLVFPADDDFNPGILDRMVEQARQGCDIVCASRFMPGGTMQGCPWLKAMLVRGAAFTLHYIARLPTHDPTSGFRLFSRRVIENLPVESDQGFTYSIELLVKAHRLGWRIGEVPALWFERKHGASRFRVLKWLPAYLRWYRYAFATTFLRRPPESVLRKPQTHTAG
jgi:dolichol-phosphate mannosyltransferase